MFSIPFLTGCLEKTQGLPIVLAGRDSTSGTREFFFDYVMQKQNFSIFLREKNSNGGVYLTVSQTPGAIGYIGLGFLDSGIKALQIDNISANISNVLNGSYPIARDLYLFTKGNATGAAQEFIIYLQSTEGQSIVREEGFVPVLNTITYNSTGKTLTGNLRISGSTTVFPIVEKARDTFRQLYPDLTLTVSSTGSGAGITAVSQGTVDIGMSSRDLKPSEQNLGLIKYTIAKDGIAIVVNPANTYINTLTLAQVRTIYTGQITNWDTFQL